MDFPHFREPEPPTTRERMFVEYYFGEACGSHRKAALMCGYAPSYAEQAGLGLLERPWVQACCEAKIKEATVSRTEALARISSAATFDHAEFFKWDDVPRDPKDPSKGTYRKLVVDLEKCQTSPHRDAIKSLKVNTNGDWVIQFHDKMDAIDKLLKIHGAYAAHNTVTVKNETPADLSPEVARRVMLAAGDEIPPELNDESPA